MIYYVTDEVQQSQYINMFREAGKDAVLLKHVIDSQFISHLEQQDQTIQFKRIDADLTEELREEDIIVHLLTKFRILDASKFDKRADIIPVLLISPV